jgi:hypothetical protein
MMELTGDGLTKMYDGRTETTRGSGISSNMLQVRWMAVLFLQKEGSSVV